MAEILTRNSVRQADDGSNGHGSIFLAREKNKISNKCRKSYRAQSQNVRVHRACESCQSSPLFCLPEIANTQVDVSQSHLGTRRVMFCACHPNSDAHASCIMPSLRIRVGMDEARQQDRDGAAENQLPPTHISCSSRRPCTLHTHPARKASLFPRCRDLHSFAGAGLKGPNALPWGADLCSRCRDFGLALVHECNASMFPTKRQDAQK
jgi:hypothetical protein